MKTPIIQERARRVKGESPSRKIPQSVIHVIGEMGHGGAELLVAEISSRMQSENIEVHIVVIGYANPSVVRKIESEGVQIHLLEGSKGWYRKLRRLRAIIREISPIVVHSHLFPALYLMAGMGTFIGNDTRSYFTEHSTSNRRRSKHWLRIVEWMVYRRFDKVICVSEAVRAALTDWIGSSPRIVVIENGINVSRFETAKAWTNPLPGQAEGSVLIGSVGALRPEKNHVLLVEAVSRLPAKFRLLLAGEGPERSRIEARVDALNLSGRVNLLGNVDDVPGFLKSIDVFAIVSKFEGFGLSAIEASAAGLPIVYTEVPGLGELLRGFGVGVDGSDAGQIAEGIKTAADIVAYRKAVPLAGKALAKRFSIERTVSLHLEAYGLAQPIGRGAEESMLPQ